MTAGPSLARNEECDIQKHSNFR